MTTWSGATLAALGGAAARVRVIALVVLGCLALAACQALPPRNPVFYRAYPGDHRPDAEIARLIPVGLGQRITHLDGNALPAPVRQGGYALEVGPGPVLLTVEFSYGPMDIYGNPYCTPNTNCSAGKGNPLTTAFVAEPGRTYHIGRETPEDDRWRIHITDAATKAVVTGLGSMQIKIAGPAAAPEPTLDPPAQLRHALARLVASDALDAVKAAERLGAMGAAAAEALPALERFVAQREATNVVINWHGSAYPIGTTVASPLPQVEALARIGGCQRLRAQLPAATDATRWMVYLSFRLVTERCAAQELVTGISKGSSLESQMAAEAAGRLRETAAVPALLAGVAEYDSMFTLQRRLKYIEALGAIGDPRAVEPLIELTDETLMGFAATGLTQPVAAALKRITGMDFGTDTAAWRRWWQTTGRAKHRLP